MSASNCGGRAIAQGRVGYAAEVAALMVIGQGQALRIVEEYRRRYLRPTELGSHRLSESQRYLAVLDYGGIEVRQRDSEQPYTP